MDLLAPPPWTEFPVIRHGSGGDRTDVICGYLDVDDPLFDPALGALPPIFVVRPTGAAAALGRVEPRVRAGGVRSGRADSQILTRLPALAARRGSPPAPCHCAGRRPRLARRAPRSGARARSRRAAPRARAQVDRRRPRDGGQRLPLAARRAVPRRPRPLADPLPHRLAPARRQGPPRAQRPSACTRSPTASGYDSEEAFSRAFKRAHGRAPAHWRVNRSTG